LFICTQGPLPTTRQQFWKMVWQENANLIVMLSQTTEEGRVISLSILGEMRSVLAKEFR